MRDVASSREALDLLRANSQLIRQIREIYDHVVVIEARHGLTTVNRYADVSQEFKSVTSLHGDVVLKRALNQRLRHELSDHRAYLVGLKAQLRSIGLSGAS